jgi:Amt family ammonium transporter
VLAAALSLAGAAHAQTPAGLSKGDTAWMLTASALVLMMTVPGLALFYGGLVRTKNMLSMLMQVFFIVCIVCILWAIYGYSLTFSEGGALNAFIGGFSKGWRGSRRRRARRRSPRACSSPNTSTSASR